MAAMLFCEMHGHWHYAMHKMETDIMLDDQANLHTNIHV